jgi:hypothetical protein
LSLPKLVPPGGVATCEFTAIESASLPTAEDAQRVYVAAAAAEQQQ